MTRSVPLTMKVPFDRHERHIAHIDVLLLDILDRLGLGVRHIPHEGIADQPAPETVFPPLIAHKKHRADSERHQRADGGENRADQPGQLCSHSG